MQKYIDVSHQTFTKPQLSGTKHQLLDQDLCSNCAERDKVIENLMYYFPEDYAQGKITVQDSHIKYKMLGNITESVAYHSQALCAY
jgi:hypothetical protein